MEIHACYCYIYPVLSFFDSCPRNSACITALFLQKGSSSSDSIKQDSYSDPKPEAKEENKADRELPIKGKY